MKKLFEKNLGAKVKRSAFDLSHEVKLSGKLAKLIPAYIQEVVPGDKFQIQSQLLVRLAPMVAPLMHRLNATIHYFFVPNRILWSGWEGFITGNEDIAVPHFDYEGTLNPGTLGDYLGLPLEFTSLPLNQLLTRAYVKIWNDYYRDENIDPEIDIEALTAGMLNEEPFSRRWEKDYFTSALPWAQKGDPAYMKATVNYRDVAALVQHQNIDPVVDATLMVTPKPGVSHEGTMQDSELGYNYGIENIESIGIEVEELRRATRLQRFLERNARSGSRYIEHLLAHWGVAPRDARLQRAEYIGGGKTPIMISEVLNTAGDALPQGNMSGHGLGVGNQFISNKFVEEHGFIIGILSIMPEPAYQQGLHKMHRRLVNLDFYYPEFAQLGEQEVLLSELFTSDGVPLDEVFGYQSRYAEYKYSQNRVHGTFKTSLAFWHMGRIFNDKPTLNRAFLECNPRVEDVFAVPSEEHCYVQMYHKVNALRPMPFFNDPKL